MQSNFTLDGFIQYVGRLPTRGRTRKNVRGHYIGFRKIGPNWYRFDDGVVHRIDLQPHYNVNLIMYRRYDTPAFISAADLSSIPVLGKVTVLNRKPKSVVSDPQEDLQQADLPESGRPPLITKSDPQPKSSQTSPKPLKPERPQRQQPSRGNKAYILYYTPDSLSSSEEDIVDKTHIDTDYIPPDQKGMLIFKFNYVNAHNWLYIFAEYFT